MSRTCYQWYFYLLWFLLMCQSNILCSVIYIWKLECLSYYLALLYGSDYSVYAQYMNELLCDMLLTIVSANFLYENSFLSNSFLVAIEWSLLPIVIRNYFRSHKWKVESWVSFRHKYLCSLEYNCIFKLDLV